MRFRFSCLPLLLACLAPGALAQARDIAITGVRIEIGNGQVIPSGTVLIHDGKIAGVGETVTVTPGAEVIDGKGMVLFPGFIDGYSTRGLKLPDAPAAGTPPDSRATAPATMWHGNRKGIRSDIIAAKCLDLKSVVSDACAQGITTGLLASGSGTVRGLASLVDYTEAGNVLVPQAATELAFRAGGGGDFQRGAGGGDPTYPGTLFGNIALMRQTLYDAQYYAAQTTPKKDEAMENLKPLVTKQVPALFAADTAREIVRASKIADEFGLKLIVSGGREAYRDLDLLMAKHIAVIAAADPGVEPTVKATPGPDATPQAVLDERHAKWVEHSQNVMRLSKAGVPFGFSSSGASIDDYLKNVRRVIKAGLPREAALHGLTSGPAAIFGIGDKVGTIETGKQANLVLMSADFADDKSEVRSVFVEGKKIDVKKGAAN